MRKYLFCLLLTATTIWADDFRSVNVENFIRETWNPQTVILDVRTEQEYNEGHIAGAVQIDMQKPDFIEKVKKQCGVCRLAVYCRSGKRSKKAAALLTVEGYTVTELDGGYLEWTNQKKPIVRGSRADIARYEANQFPVNKQFNLQYRITRCQGEGEPIIVLYLHDSSARGIDNELPVRQRNLQRLVQYLDSTKRNAIVVVPQCRIDRRWNEYRPMQGCLLYDAVYKLVEKIAKENDTQQIYLTGDSFGGAGVWKLLSDHPKHYRAGLIADSYPLNNVTAKKVAQTPLLLIASTQNKNLVQIQTIAADIKQVKSNSLTYKEVPNTHREACRMAFDREYLDWLFNQ